MQIQTLKLAKLNPAPYNPRKDLKPGDIEYDKLKKSILEFSCVEPLIWNKQTGNLIGGHQRLKILKELGQKETEVSIVNLPPKKEKALNLALNKISGEWDPLKLKDVIADIDDGTFDIEVTGFDDIEIDHLMDSLDPEKIGEDEFDPEKALSEIKKPLTKPGDIYTMGQHRLICGDSRQESPYSSILPGAPADMVFTDPPYNVNYSGQGKLGGIKNDNMSEEAFIAFTLDFFTQIKQNLKLGGSFYICSGWSSYPTFVYAIKALGMDFANPIVWVKNNTTLGWNDYKYKYEMVVKGKVETKGKKKSTPILYGWNGGAHYFADTRFESDVWEVKRKASNSMVHPTQKPLELIGKAIKNSSKPGQIILDNFAGSGATLIACEMTKRVFRGIELDPKFCDVIVDRWQSFTGAKAIRNAKKKDRKS